MIADLHTHTNCSDGSLTPEQLICNAAEAGVTMLSITDHDTAAAYTDKVRSHAVQQGITLIEGIEFSTTWQRQGVHIVGLNIDSRSDMIRQGISSQTQARTSRAEEISRRLHKTGIENALQGAQQYAPDGFIGRPHFARFLVESGKVKNTAQAFKRYLGSGKPGDVKQHWAEMEAVIAWINDSGGTAVLAHPLKYKLTLTKLKRLVDDFIALGGKGIEVISGLQQPNATQTLSNLCQQKQLLASTGSDFHTPGQGWAALGKQPALPDGLPLIWENW